MQGRGGAWVRVSACWGACRWCQRPCVRPADVDDCADSPCCQQVCSNSPGGYECGCYAGYRLSSDGCGCEGEPGAAGGPRRARGARGAAPGGRRAPSMRLSGSAFLSPSVPSRFPVNVSHPGLGRVRVVKGAGPLPGRSSRRPASRRCRLPRPPAAAPALLSRRRLPRPALGFSLSS